MPGGYGDGTYGTGLYVLADPGATAGYGDGLYGFGSYSGSPASGPGTPTVHSVERASYILEVAWNAYSVGIFTFDTSLFDGPDTLGVSPFDIRFTGPNDDLSTIFDGAHVNRGRSNTRDSVLAGAATINLRDRAGLLNPENAASPVYAQLEDRLHPVRLKGTFGGVNYGIFYGWIRSSVWEPNGRKGTARLECVDLFWWLNRATPTIAATGVTTTGAAIALILAAVGWTDPLAQNLDTGDTIPSFVADGKKTALQLIQELLEAERGVFFIDGNGVATYKDRLARVTMTSQATVVDTMSNLTPGVDFETVISRVTVTRTQNSYAAVAVDDPASRKLGFSDEAIETAYLPSDTAADDLAAFMLNQLKTPKEPLFDLTLDNRDASQLTQVLARDLVDQITVVSDRGDVAGDFHIDQIEHQITRDRHTAVWLCSRELDVSPLLFDTSLFDGTDVFVF